MVPFCVPACLPASDVAFVQMIYNDSDIFGTPGADAGASTPISVSAASQTM